MPENSIHPIKHAVDEFIKDLDSLATAAPISLIMLGMSRVFAESAFNEFVSLHFKEEEVTSQGNVEIPRAAYGSFNKLHRRFDHARNALKITPRSFVVSLTSQYDVFLARLICAVFRIHPEMLASSEKKFSFSEISAFGTLEEFKTGLVDAEVDALLRKSVVEQFTWMENKFSVSLHSDLPVWPEFVEIFQRRNLFVHADGIVSKQYLDVCKSQGVELSGVKIGDQLKVDSAYFRRAHAVLSEIGVKLSQVLWRKLEPESLKAADAELNAICFGLLQQEKYQLAKNLLDFAFIKSLKRYNKELELMLLVNRANAYRLSGDKDRCLQIIANCDWSAFAPQFQLARAVLADDLGEALRLMLEIGADSTPTKHDYREWPLFKVMRNNDRFRDAFVQIFNEPLFSSADLDVDMNMPARLKSELSGIQSPAFMATLQQQFSGEMGGWLESIMGIPEARESPVNPIVAAKAKEADAVAAPAKTVKKSAKLKPVLKEK